MTAALGEQRVRGGRAVSRVAALVEALGLKPEEESFQRLRRFGTLLHGVRSK